MPRSGLGSRAILVKLRWPCLHLQRVGSRAILKLTIHSSRCRFAARLNSGVRPLMDDRPPFGNRHPVLVMLLLPFLVVAALIAKLFSKPIHRTAESVVAILQRRLSDAPDWYEWDEFICVRISDKTLDDVRAECQMIQPNGQEPPTFMSASDRANVQMIIDQLQRSNNSFNPMPLRGTG